MNLADVRAELPVLRRVAYLNTGSFGPLPRRAAEAMAAQQRRELEEGRGSNAYWESLRELRARCRESMERLLSAPRGSVALTRSTTEGCNIAVAAVGLSAGDEVVTTDDEHVGLLGALHVSGARLRVAAVTDLPAGAAADAVIEQVGPRTRLVALSHVTWTKGRVLPVADIAARCRERGIPLLVDGAQGAGAIPVDVGALGCDFYTVSGQKWLLGPDATGALFVRPELTDRLAVRFPSGYGLARHDLAGGLEFASGAVRFEPGAVPAPALAGLLEALAFARDAGPERFSRARELTERCRELLAGRCQVLTGPGEATLVAFRARGKPEDVVSALAREGVIVRGFPGLDWLRASVGFWTSEEELERLANGLPR